MRLSVLFFCRVLFRLLPETRLFSLKADLLRVAGARLGSRVRVCSSAVVLGGGDLLVGDDTWIGHEAMICAGSRVTIGRSVDIGPRVYVGTGTHEIDASGVRAAGAGVNRDVVIGDGVWLGACSVILPGVTLGPKAVIAAGAVVAEDVPARVVVGGVPAKVLRTL